ncbi:MAG: sodium-dependent bicarbonate transport family permease [Planctomycetaceae bacterium]|nr:sodium-dependent bicarbonate transport family permease [Planctomycetaceae bacterium]
MNFDLIADNLLAAPILFFLLGFVVIALKADVEIPHPLPKLLSLYLVIAIGLKGGIELHHGGLPPESIRVILACITMSLVMPLIAFGVLRSRLDVYNSAAIAATYGSVSAVTFITAISAIESLGLTYHGHMVAAMALMEAPPIVLGVALVSRFSGENQTKVNWGKLLHDSLLHGPIILLLGSLFVGRLISDKSAAAIKPFFSGLFPGLLCLYLFDMGLNAARRLTNVNLVDKFLVGFAVVMPLLGAAAGITISCVLGVSRGDALLITVLCASASYIAVPAAMQLSVPKADPSVYLTMALGFTFPFNIAIGIPLYLATLNLLNL